MVMTAETRMVEPVQRSEIGLSESAEAGQAIMSALLNRSEATFTILTDARSVMEFASPLRQFLLMSGSHAGGVSAAIAPRFSEQTYPALLDLVGRLNGSGASELWRPNGARTVALGEARQMFISADMPVIEKSQRPDRLLEVVSADEISADWYQKRVARRVSDSSVVKVFYGKCAVDGSVFASADVEAMAQEAMAGQRRRFSLLNDEVRV